MQTHHHTGTHTRRSPAPQAITPRPTPAGTLSDAEIRQIIRETLG